MPVKPALFIALFVLLRSFIYAQEPSKNASLIVVHYNTADKAALQQDVYAYHFVNGAYTGPELLLSVKGRKEGKDYIRLDEGTNLLYKDRYLVSAAGAIIDLNEKKVLYDGYGKPVKCSGDSIVFYVNDIFKGKYYAYYDLQKRSYSPIASPTYKALPGQDIEFDKRQEPYKLMLYPRNQPGQVLLSDAGYASGKNTKEPAVLWLDNNRLLFTYVTKGATTVQVLLYTISTKGKTVIGTAPCDKEARISLNSGIGGEPELRINGKAWRIDLKTPGLQEKKTLQLTNGFEADATTTSKGRSILSKGNVIGTYHCNPDQIRCNTRYLALVKELSIDNETYQQGIAVWDTIEQQWQNIDADETPAFVGWINQ